MRRLEKEFADKERFLDDKYSAESKTHRGQSFRGAKHLCATCSFTRHFILLSFVSFAHYKCAWCCLDATTRLSDQVDGQLRTINELNNVVSDHERTIGNDFIIKDSTFSYISLLNDTSTYP